MVWPLPFIVKSPLRVIPLANTTSSFKVIVPLLLSDVWTPLSVLVLVLFIAFTLLFLPSTSFWSAVSSIVLFSLCIACAVEVVVSPILLFVFDCSTVCTCVTSFVVVAAVVSVLSLADTAQQPIKVINRIKKKQVLSFLFNLIFYLFIISYFSEFNTITV